MKTTSKINWDEMRVRSGRVSEHELSEAELAEIFAARAKSLASLSGQETEDLGSDVFRFSVGAARFALEMIYVRTILAPRWLTRVPGAPAHLSHVAHVGGRVVSLFRLDRFMDLGDVKAAPDKYLMLEHEGVRLGLAATAFGGIDRLDLTDLNAAGQGAAGDLIRGVANDMTVVLDGARVVQDLRVEVGRADEG